MELYETLIRKFDESCDRHYFSFSVIYARFLAQVLVLIWVHDACLVFIFAPRCEIDEQNKVRGIWIGNHHPQV